MPSILITGGTGTFGNAATRQLLARHDVEKIVIFSRDEQKQEEMRRRFDGEDRLRYFVGDVRDPDRLRMALQGAEIVLHAAAMKIVPTCEYDPFEAVKTNVQGSQNLIDMAIRCGVRAVIALSTDKAVSPINLYGATKLTMEKLFSAANNLSGAKGPMFSVARYGNVSGSRGSVIPLWRRLAAEGRPLPLTDPQMTRFWITAEHAVDFILASLTIQLGGETFIPKMPSYRVRDLGTVIYGCDDYPREIVGLRPGEKIHEDLITSHEGRATVENEHAYVICPPWLTPETSLRDGFSLNSSNNPWWIGVDSLTKRLKEIA
jgi:UDP-N-acetylglucosamine 4,6-dehydratase/5-epimerase